MKRSISADPRALNPFNFLPGSLAIFCFHSWLQDRLFSLHNTHRLDPARKRKRFYFLKSRNSFSYRKSIAFYVAIFSGSRWVTGAT